MSENAFSLGEGGPAAAIGDTREQALGKARAGEPTDKGEITQQKRNRSETGSQGKKSGREKREPGNEQACTREVISKAKSTKACVGQKANAKEQNRRHNVREKDQEEVREQEKEQKQQQEKCCRSCLQ